MSDNNLCKKNIHELSELLKRRETSSKELTEAFISRVKKFDGDINSYLTRAFDSARKQAEVADKKISSGSGVTELTGIPMALKDIFVTKGIRTTCASKMLENYIPPYDARVTKGLQDAGIVMLGKLNMDEFAMGASNEYSAFGAVKNPWDLSRTPGGSSGGSSAAVAKSLCAGSVGTDTGGSVRLPASFCGVVGLKPTYGRVSRYGMIAFASSLDQAGPITKCVKDSAIILKHIAGHDANDSTSIPADVPDYSAALTGNVKGKRIGIPKEFFVSGIEPEVEKAVRDSAKKFQELGAEIVEISLPHSKYAVPCYYIVAPAEASSNLARYDGIRYGFRTKDFEDLADLFKNTRAEGFGPQVSLRILVGTYVLSSGYYDAYYLRAQKVRTLIKNDFDSAFKTCDAIIAPTSTETAFRLGEKSNDNVKMYLNDIFTAPVNLAGLPAISIPCGYSANNLPIGLQIIGKPLGEGELLNTAYAYEQATEWHKRLPPE